MSPREESGRRAVLKSLGAALATGGIAGTAAAGSGSGNGKADPQPPNAVYGGLEKPLYSGNMKSLREMAKVAEELTNDTDTAPSTVVPGAADDGVGTNQENVGDISNLDPVGGWSYDYDIADPYLGITYANVENAATLYKSQERDNDGYYHYMMWLWSQGEANSIWGYDWFWQQVDVQTDSVYLSQWAPSTRIDKHKKPVSVGLDVGLSSGPTIGLSGSTEIAEGVFFTDELTQGPNGEHRIKFDANGTTDKVNGINGVTHFRSQNDYDLYQDSLPRGHFYMKAKGFAD